MGQKWPTVLTHVIMFYPILIPYTPVEAQTCTITDAQGYWQYGMFQRLPESWKAIYNRRDPRTRGG